MLRKNAFYINYSKLSLYILFNKSQKFLNQSKSSSFSKKLFQNLMIITKIYQCNTPNRIKDK